MRTFLFFLHSLALFTIRIDLQDEKKKKKKKKRFTVGSDQINNFKNDDVYFILKQSPMEMCSACTSGICGLENRMQRAEESSERKTEKYKRESLYAVKKKQRLILYNLASTQVFAQPIYVLVSFVSK
ncbi:hypothetical protein PUN28_010593 [Cardiocondyla obscurior]|uniref:Secreted protein n=1 Tax=Cardiocondyla obscurior TaxID=286306 RepID=A0AAW2FMA7_9HYME